MKSFFSEANGRVNLIGEHTDYNGGFVLPTAIPQKTSIELKPRNDEKVILRSEKMEDQNKELEFELGHEKLSKTWMDYAQGITWVLQQEGFSIGGFEAQIESSVPIGSGLSSSAALEISLLRALRECFSLKIDDVKMARIGQRAENDFVGARVGIMDQMSCSLASHGEALFIDTRDLSYSRIPLPLRHMDLVVINSGVSHSHSSNEYNKRRAECEEACRLLGIPQLRDLSVGQLNEAKSKLPFVLFQRARHVVTENARVLKTVTAIRELNLNQIGECLNGSHASLRDDYQVSIPEIDLMVRISQEISSVIGARITGGGFGGSIIVLCLPGEAKRTAERIVERTKELSPGLHPAILVP